MHRSATEVVVHDIAPCVNTIRDDVLLGLSRCPKELPSQYLYDARGAKLFEQICDTREYYLTRTELGILNDNMAEISECVGFGAFVIEPGSGSGLKTRNLLKGLDNPSVYIPVDVAKKQLASFATSISREFPAIEVRPVCADFTDHFDVPAEDDDAHMRLCFFPGSTIGNFKPAAALDVLNRMAEMCGCHGCVLIGVDMKKDRKTLEAAYDDEQGVSREFALNYLVRLNRELDAGIQIEQFAYEAPYNESLGRIEMALVSLCDQEISIAGTPVRFKKNERISTEYSCKFTHEEFAALAEKAGLNVHQVWTDSERLFSIQYLEPK
ncbi:MAG: dimethylhistidine N-methyltransferase [Phycisphaerae bacterium]|nr:MAG: dimethylhistidine N-methyltransferase [Phycisphaerae bacterium]